MLIDSHCHLPNIEKAKTIVNEAKDEGISELINIGTSIKDSEGAVKIAEYFPNVFATIGIYPSEDNNISIKELDNNLRKLLGRSKKIVGIGECGLDITERSLNSKTGRSLEDQINLFRMQINISLKYDLPVVMHNRNGDKHIINILGDYQTKDLLGVSHCFDSNWEMAKKLMDLNFFISFSGLITYPNKKALIEVLQKIPEDRILVETDSPYLPPQGHRGQKNCPKYARIIARKIAEVRDVPYDKVCETTYNNTCKVFSNITPH